MAAIEHAGLALAAKPLSPKVHLALLAVATEVLDLVWALLYALKIETFAAAPWSHSLFGAVCISILFGACCAAAYRDLRSGIVLASLVLSHWVVDLITHPMTYLFPNDMGVTLAPWLGLRMGFGLYSTLGGLIVGWSLLVLPGAVIYLLYRMRRARGSK